MVPGMTPEASVLIESSRRPVSDLAGRVVLVTGGGRGLGEAICSVLGARGAVVIAADIEHGRALHCATTVSENGGTAEGIGLDVTDVGDVINALAGIVERHGALDAVINNAGVDITKPIDDITVEEFDRVLDVNLRGPFLVAKHAMPLLTQGQGHLVNIVSTASKRAWANASAYHASKWGLLGLSHALHVEGRERGVKVTAIIAGGMRTPFILDRFPDLDAATLQDPRNVANAVAFALTQPEGTVVPELTVIPMQETSWP
ncbi:MAG: bdh [Thermoleophilia bacterium]|nr:bdh [Thermoleophilia bacterium]